MNGKGREELRVRKKVLRKELILRRAEQESKEQRVKSKEIERKLFSLNEFKKAESVMFYVSGKDEVMTESMIERAIAAGKRVIVPSLRETPEDITPSLLLDYENDLEKGMFGFWSQKRNA